MNFKNLAMGIVKICISTRWFMTLHWQRDSDTAIYRRIGDLLCDGEHQEFHMAVAWTRISGLKLLAEVDGNPLTAFLESGGQLRITTGVGVQTSTEALDALLDLSHRYENQVEIYIYHSENLLFHPKVYYFTGDSPRLILGSNNLTNSGLLQNREVSIELAEENNVNWAEVNDFFSQLQTPSAPEDGELPQIIRLTTSEEIRRLERLGLISPERTVGNRLKKAARKARGGRSNTGMFNVAQRLPHPQTDGSLTGIVSSGQGQGQQQAQGDGTQGEPPNEPPGNQDGDGNDNGGDPPELGPLHIGDSTMGALIEMCANFLDHGGIEDTEYAQRLLLPRSGNFSHNSYYHNAIGLVLLFLRSAADRPAILSQVSQLPTVMGLAGFQVPNQIQTRFRSWLSDSANHSLEWETENGNTVVVSNARNHVKVTWGGTIPVLGVGGQSATAIQGAFRLIANHIWDPELEPVPQDDA